MGSSSKTSIDTAAAKSLDASVDCFEVDDIAAFDPITESAGKKPVAKPASKPVTTEALMEIELSADDMDAMLGDDVVSLEVS